MKTAHIRINEDNQSQSTTSGTSGVRKKNISSSFVDNRPEAIAQRKLQEEADNSTKAKQLRTFQDMANNSPQAKQAIQLQAMADNHSLRHEVRQKKENNTGLSDSLKTGIENLSGYSMDDVKVHYNSARPAQLQAHAYAQGTEIHLGPGQEKHMPHEAWHVVQQMQGRVKPTLHMKNGVNINDDPFLEKEADVMSNEALNTRPDFHIAQPDLIGHRGSNTIQRITFTDNQINYQNQIVNPQANVNQNQNRITSYRAEAGLPTAYQIISRVFPNATVHLDSRSTNIDRPHAIEASIREQAVDRNANEAFVRAVGNQGEDERKILEGAGHGYTYDGGHLIGATMFGGAIASAAYNLAPQERELNQTAYNSYFESAIRRTQGYDNRQITLKVTLGYSHGDYRVNGHYLLARAIISYPHGGIDDLDQEISIPVRIPQQWFAQARLAVQNWEYSLRNNFNPNQNSSLTNIPNGNRGYKYGAPNELRALAAHVGIIPPDTFIGVDGTSVNHRLQNLENHNGLQGHNNIVYSGYNLGANDTHTLHHVAQQNTPNYTPDLNLAQGNLYHVNARTAAQIPDLNQGIEFAQVNHENLCTNLLNILGTKANINGFQGLGFNAKNISISTWLNQNIPNTNPNQIPPINGWEPNVHPSDRNLDMHHIEIADSPALHTNYVHYINKRQELSLLAVNQTRQIRVLRNNWNLYTDELLINAVNWQTRHNLLINVLTNFNVQNDMALDFDHKKGLLALNRTKHMNQEFRDNHLQAILEALNQENKDQGYYNVWLVDESWINSPGWTQGLNPGPALINRLAVLTRYRDSFFSRLPVPPDHRARLGFRALGKRSRVQIDEPDAESEYSRPNVSNLSYSEDIPDIDIGRILGDLKDA